MKRILAIVACAMMLSATAASADDTSQRTGNKGLGVDAALNLSSSEAANGISGRYQVSDKLGAQAIFRLDFVSGPGDLSTTFLNLGLRAIYNLVSVQNAAFGAVGGLGIYRLSVDPGVEGVDGESELGLSLEGGLRAEYFVTRSFSIHGEVGIVFAFLGGEDLGTSALPGSPDGTTIFLGDGDLVGNAGFTFWF